MKRNASLTCLSSAFNESKSALRYKWTFLGGVAALAGRRLDSAYKASWSDMPGITSTRLTRDGFLQKKRSRIFSVSSVILVGSVTSWLRK